MAKQRLAADLKQKEAEVILMMMVVETVVIKMITKVIKILIKDHADSDNVAHLDLILCKLLDQSR